MESTELNNPVQESLPKPQPPDHNRPSNNAVSSGSFAGTLAATRSALAGTRGRLAALARINSTTPVRVDTIVPTQTTIEQPHVANMQIRPELQVILDEVTHFSDKFPLKTVADPESNPYRETLTFTTTAEGEEYYLDILQRLNQLGVSIEPTDPVYNMLTNARSQLTTHITSLRDRKDTVKAKIANLETAITMSDIEPERNVTALETAKNIIEINRQTVKVPERIWDMAGIEDLSTDQVVALINAQGSGRYFLHSFPEISIQNGYITTGVGGGGEFASVRGDSSDHINFTCEQPLSRGIRPFYGTLGNLTGGVFYPAEVMLENYPFINLPYSRSSGTSSEWRSYAPSDKPKSTTHHIPLRAGVCFFADTDRTKIEELINQLPENERPNKIVWYRESEGEQRDQALTTFLQGLKEFTDLPHLSSHIEIIDTKNGMPVFGTPKARHAWNTE